MFTSQAISSRRSRLTQSWKSILPPKVAVLILSGSPIQKPGGFDQCYPAARRGPQPLRTGAGSDPQGAGRLSRQAHQRLGGGAESFGEALDLGLAVAPDRRGGGAEKEAGF